MMKKLVAVVMVLALTVTCVSALADVWTEGGCGRVVSTYCSVCKTTTQFVCGSHTVSTWIVDCPDNIANCVCTYKKIEHCYTCVTCRAKFTVFTESYRHTK